MAVARVARSPTFDVACLVFLATWWLLDKSPYMVYGEVPLPDGTIQRMTEVEIPTPRP